jgi:hypothetical protein
MNSKHHGYVVRAGGVAGILAVAAFGLPRLRREILPLPTDRCRDAHFNAVAWRDSSQVYSDAAVRGCIVDDLLVRHPMVGRRRTDVVILLGEPKPTPYFKNYDLVYWLGPERGLMSIDSEWLVMRLDSIGRVKEVRLVTD